MGRIAIGSGIEVGGGAELLLIAGPDVIESEELVRETGTRLKEISARHGVSYVLKCSFDKANRTSHASFRGPGIDEGLEILKRIRDELEIPILSDVHNVQQAEQAGGVLDVIQIPAFLCRQTDLIQAAAKTGKPLNIKKGQFLAPWDMKNVIEKAKAAGAERILLTERGTSFGYNNLVTDFRSIPIMKETGCPVVFDATHSLQLPGGLGSETGGMRQHIPTLTRAAVAAGADALFCEVHPDPPNALCDRTTMVTPDEIDTLLGELVAIKKSIEGVGPTTFVPMEEL